MTEETEPEKMNRRTETVSIDLTPMLLERDSVLVTNDQSAALRLDDDAILYTPANRTSLVVNSAAFAIWQCFDGQSTLGDIADDLADIAELDPESAWRDVRSLSQTLVTAGAAHEPDARPQSETPSQASGALPDPPSR